MVECKLVYVEEMKLENHHWATIIVIIQGRSIMYGKTSKGMFNK